MKKFLIMLLTVALFLSSVECSTVCADTTPDWRQMYLDYLNKNYKDKDLDTYDAALIYVDNDDVPELYINSHETFAANELCLMLTIKNNKVKSFDISNEMMYYAPKKNRMLCQYGAGLSISGYWKMSQMKNGKEKELCVAYRDQDLTQQKPFYYYHVNSKLVSKAKYQKAVKNMKTKYKWKKVDKKLKPMKTVMKVLDSETE
ncbi:MAG: hypothetical protein MR663_11200 [Lachnospiraceae bacterium]|nr:hypothetical protein [Lachnospiraceae bacterium]